MAGEGEASAGYWERPLTQKDVKVNDRPTRKWRHTTLPEWRLA